MHFFSFDRNVREIMSDTDNLTGYKVKCSKNGDKKGALMHSHVESVEIRNLIN